MCGPWAVDDCAGIGIPLGILLFVVWLRTTTVTRRRVARGQEVSWADQAHLFLRSIGVTLSLIALICVAVGATFTAACFACAGVYSGLEAAKLRDVSLYVGFLVFAVVAAIVAITLFILIKKPAIQFWKQDVGDPD